jgi:zona occludens toxin
MIYLITGQPGNGKTLYALDTIEKRRLEESRPVYYHGIKELTLPWFPLDDPHKWHELPEGSIIVIDECQKSTFPPMPSAAKRPLHYTELETHRHKGFDLYLLTQNPSLIDNHPKKLAGKHLHIIRSFGMQRADVFEMQSAMDPNAKNLKTALRKEYVYNKDVYDWYKSAEIHTHKRKLPWKYYAIPVALLVVIASSWASIHFLTTMGKKGVEKVDSVSATPAQLTANSSTLNGAKAKSMTQAEYVAAYQPRLEGLEYTAPVYDDVTKPEEAPVPVACMTSKSKGCRCYSQQATRLAMSDSMCESIITKGFFLNFTPKSQQQSESVAARHEPPSVRDSASQMAGSQEGRKVSIYPYSTGTPAPSSPYPNQPVNDGAQVYPAPPVTQVNDSTNPRYNVALRGQ